MHARRTGIRKHVAIVLLAIGFASRTAVAQPLPPHATMAGHTLGEWSAMWWRWAIEIPVGQNPLLDTTGAQAYRGDVDPNVFFLAGSPTNDPFTRNVTVPAGKHLFFPIINFSTDNTNVFGQPPTNFSAAELSALIAPIIDSATDLFATVDGNSVMNVASHREMFGAPGFSYTVNGPDNLIAYYGYDPTLGTGMYPATVSPVVADGYWLALAPLDAGQHTLHWGGRIPDLGGPGVDFLQDITVHLNVVPEPATLGLGALALLMSLRARRAKDARFRDSNPA